MSMSIAVSVYRMSTLSKCPLTKCVSLLTLCSSSVVMIYKYASRSETLHFITQCLCVLYDCNNKQELFSQTGLTNCHYRRGTIILHEDLYAYRQTWNRLKDEPYMEQKL